MFNFEDLRYNRQINMPEWGQDEQEKLKNSSVVVIGSGGVKSTLLLCLVAAGIGKLRIIEFDRVELSNLNRQLLFRTEDIGRKKVDVAAETLKSLDPEISIEAIDAKVTNSNIDDLLGGFDVVVEGGDCPAGRNMINEYCLKKGIPMIHPSAQFSYGYVLSVIPKLKTACFACYFPDDHTRKEHTGPVPVNVLSTSVAGSLGAAEVIKYLLDHIESMSINEPVNNSV